MAGIYLHLPFCRRKCHYCNFFSLASHKQKGSFLQALEKEIRLTRSYLAGEAVETIYFGGGTPSLYPPSSLQRILDVLAPVHGFSSSDLPAEITLELNPEDVTANYVSELKNTWFNRFSLGVQSFFDDDLSALNRTHSANQALRAVELLQKSGFQNISIDLIFGLPSAESSTWQENLKIFFSLGVQHLSAYALTVEPRTPLAWMIEHKKSKPVNDERQAAEFILLMELAKQHGFQQYEISNFSLPGYTARHNTNYWKGIPYLGLGPSAHSYNRVARRWNISNLSGYLEKINLGQTCHEEETLTPVQKYNEFVMTSLRTAWGCDQSTIEREFGLTLCHYFRQQALPFIESGWMTEHSGSYCLTDEGKLFADSISSSLFFADESD